MEQKPSERKVVKGEGNQDTRNNPIIGILFAEVERKYSRIRMRSESFAQIPAPSGIGEQNIVEAHAITKEKLSDRPWVLHVETEFNPQTNAGNLEDIYELVARGYSYCLLERMSQYLQRDIDIAKKDPFVKEIEIENGRKVTYKDVEVGMKPGLFGLDPRNHERYSDFLERVAGRAALPSVVQGIAPTESAYQREGAVADSVKGFADELMDTFMLSHNVLSRYFYKHSGLIEQVEEEVKKGRFRKAGIDHLKEALAAFDQGDERRLASLAGEYLPPSNMNALKNRMELQEKYGYDYFEFAQAMYETHDQAHERMADLYERVSPKDWDDPQYSLSWPELHGAVNGLYQGHQAGESWDLPDVLREFQRFYLYNVTDFQQGLTLQNYLRTATDATHSYTEPLQIEITQPIRGNVMLYYEVTGHTARAHYHMAFGDESLKGKSNDPVKMDFSPKRKR